MSETTLAEAFRSGSGRKIDWQGQTLWSYLRLSVKDGDRLNVVRLSASPVRAQALKLSVDKGGLRANGVVVSTAAIWSHTAPETAELEVVGRRARFVDVWNAWSLDGVDSSWIGNAAMSVDTDGATHTIRCSDGMGEVTFDDLVVRLELAGDA